MTRPWKNKLKVILLNENAWKMFNFPSVHGTSFAEVSRHPEMRKLLEEVLAYDCSKECFTKEITLGEERWLRVSVVSLRSAGKRFLGYALVFHDITELKRLERVRTDFVANVSHELRTPLTAIRGYAETLLRNPPDDTWDNREFLGIIYRHSERLGRLIDDLLALSDLEFGKVRLVKERMALGDLIGRVLEILRDQSRKKNILLFHTVESNMPPVPEDPDRLQQLLINLVDNAIKCTPAGGRVRIRAGLFSGNSERPTVEIAVADTGCGIPEKDLPRITERSYRMDNARSRELGRHGLRIGHCEAHRRRS